MNLSSLRLDRPGVRLGWALGASLVLHLALLAPARWWLSPATPTLPPMMVELAEPEPVSALATQPEPELPPEPAVAPAPTLPAEVPAAPSAPRPLRGKALAAATAALSEELFYPREAIERGLEGRVIVLLTLDAAGRIESAEVASGSGHDILDAAALQAVRRIARVGGSARQVLLPVDFRLD